MPYGIVIFLKFLMDMPANWPLKVLDLFAIWPLHGRVDEPSSTYATAIVTFFIFTLTYFRCLASSPVMNSLIMYFQVFSLESKS